MWEYKRIEEGYGDNMSKKCKDCKDFDPLTSFWGKCKINGVKRDTYDEDTCMLGKKLLKLKVVYTGKTCADKDRVTSIVEGYSEEEVKEKATSQVRGNLGMLISSEWVEGFEGGK